VVGPDLNYNHGGGDAFVAKVSADGKSLEYCGFIGGDYWDEANDISVDKNGHAFVVGHTMSTESTFPVNVGPDLTSNGIYDAFVAKISIDGTMLNYCGYIGGINDDLGNGIAIDESGRVYITGETWSDDSSFPVTVGPYLSYVDYKEAFVARVSEDGSSLEYCGYIGGEGDEYGYDIAVNSTSEAFVIGLTCTTEYGSFPLIVGPDLTFNWSGPDCFVAKVSADGTHLKYCGYIGGDGWDVGTGIAVNDSGNAFVTGYTESTETTFPVTIGPDLTHNGGDWDDYDGFVAKVSKDGTGLEYCGYIGGEGDEYYYGNYLPNGNLEVYDDHAYVVGWTNSTEATFPVVNGPDLTHNGGTDAYIARVSEDGTHLDICGYIGGTGGETGWGIAVDASGNIYVAGYTTSTESSFPVLEGPDLTFNGGYSDAFVAKIEHRIYLRVPEDYTTIQEAINVAVDGDTVMAYPGTYYENIDFKGKAITVTSKEGPEVTVIDGGQKRSVVTFRSGEGQDSVLDGFSLTNGIGALGWFERMGGGIFCFNASPTIKNNIIFHNVVECTSSGGSGYGGGIYCCNSNAIITNNTIKDNLVGDCAGGGGGVYFNKGKATMTGNIISGNRVLKDGSGGGIHCYGTGNFIANNMIIDNHAGSLRGDGGGLYLDGESLMVNNTICANSAPMGVGGGIESYSYSTVEIINTIVWNNNSKADDQINGTPEVRYCDIQDGFSGPCNIDQEPLFLDPGHGDYHLIWNSPCVNRGKNVGSTYDFEGDKRRFMGSVDMGADEFMGTHPLEADVFKLSVYHQTPINFKLNGGPGHANKEYILFGGRTGNAPGTTFHGGSSVLPVNWDSFTEFVLRYTNTSLFVNFEGELDPMGSGWALFDPQGSVTAGMVGITLSFGYIMPYHWDFASNPINVLIIP